MNIFYVLTSTNIRFIHFIPVGIYFLVGEKLFTFSTGTGIETTASQAGQLRHRIVFEHHGNFTADKDCACRIGIRFRHTFASSMVLRKNT